MNSNEELICSMIQENEICSLNVFLFFFSVVYFIYIYFILGEFKYGQPSQKCKLQLDLESLKDLLEEKNHSAEVHSNGSGLYDLYFIYGEHFIVHTYLDGIILLSHFLHRFTYSK